MKTRFLEYAHLNMMPLEVWRPVGGVAEIQFIIIPALSVCAPSLLPPSKSSLELKMPTWAKAAVLCITVLTICCSQRSVIAILGLEASGRGWH